MLEILGLVFLGAICFMAFVIVGCAFHGGMDYFCNEQEINKRLDNFAEMERGIQLIRKQLEEDINYLRIKLNDEIICRQLDYKNITEFLKKKGKK